jgi:uracil-DNA glycosylase
MKSVDKRKHLLVLQTKIENSISDPWTFEQRGAVEGFLGRGPIMFVGERPSTSPFPSRRSDQLYNALTRAGLADSHLTDIIKTRGKVGVPYPDDLGQHKEIFNEELAIVRPRIVVAFGNTAYAMLRWHLAGTQVVLRRLCHYSFAYGRGSPSAGRRFEEQLAEVAQLLDP